MRQFKTRFVLPRLDSQQIEPSSLSQSELHLAVVLGAKYKNDVPKKISEMYPAAGGGKLNLYTGNDNLVEIIDAMRSKLGRFNADEIKYILELQARLLVPPQQKLTVETIRMSSLNETKREAYNDELQKIIKTISFTMLYELNASNKSYFHNNLTLFRTA